MTSLKCCFLDFTTKFKFYKIYIHLLSSGSYMHLKSCRIHFILFLVNIKMYLLSILYLQSANLCDSKHAMNPDDDNKVITIKQKWSSNRNVDIVLEEKIASLLKIVFWQNIECIGNNYLSLCNDFQCSHGFCLVLSLESKHVSHKYTIQLKFHLALCLSYIILNQCKQ